MTVYDLKEWRENDRLVKVFGEKRELVVTENERTQRQKKCAVKFEHFSFPDVDFELWHELSGVSPIVVRCSCGNSVVVDVPFYSKKNSIAGIVGYGCSCGGPPPPMIYQKYTKEIDDVISHLVEVEKKDT